MTSQSVLSLAPKLHPHLGTHAQVARVGLLQLLDASSRTPVAAILAPPGYGKTTLLAQWAERDPRAFGWLTIDWRDNDPAVLLRDLAAAFEGIEPVGRSGLDMVGASGASLVDAVLPQLGSALSVAALPAVLVLDDVHLLQNRDGLDAVTRDDYSRRNLSCIAAGRAPRRWPACAPRPGCRSAPMTWPWTAGGQLLLEHEGRRRPFACDLFRRTEVAGALQSRPAPRRPARPKAAARTVDEPFLSTTEFELLSRLPTQLARPDPGLFPGPHSGRCASRAATTGSDRPARVLVAVEFC